MEPHRLEGSLTKKPLGPSVLYEQKTFGPAASYKGHFYVGWISVANFKSLSLTVFKQDRDVRQYCLLALCPKLSLVQSLDTIKKTKPDKLFFKWESWSWRAISILLKGGRDRCVYDDWFQNPCSSYFTILLEKNHDNDINICWWCVLPKISMFLYRQQLLSTYCVLGILLLKMSSHLMLMTYLKGRAQKSFFSKKILTRRG